MPQPYIKTPKAKLDWKMKDILDTNRWRLINQLMSCKYPSQLAKTLELIIMIIGTWKQLEERDRKNKVINHWWKLKSKKVYNKRMILLFKISIQEGIQEIQQLVQMC